MFNVYKNQQSRQTGSRNLMGPKTLPTIWGTYIKLVTKYQISAINSCWEKCNEKCAYMFNVYKNQLSRQTGSRNMTGPKTLPTIWHTYMKLCFILLWAKVLNIILCISSFVTYLYPHSLKGEGGILFISVRQSKIFFVTFF
jgi:hypothetical protein